MPFLCSGVPVGMHGYVGTVQKCVHGDSLTAEISISKYPLIPSFSFQYCSHLALGGFWGHPGLAGLAVISPTKGFSGFGEGGGLVFPYSTSSFTVDRESLFVDRSGMEEQSV